MRVELPDDNSGSVSGIYSMTFDYGAEGATYINDVQTVQLCKGVSPTSAPSTNPSVYSDYQNIFY